MAKKKDLELEPRSRALLAAKWSSGQAGWVAGALAYLQAVHSPELKQRCRDDQILADTIQAQQRIYAESTAIHIAKVMDQSTDVLSLKTFCEVVEDDVHHKDTITHALRYQKGAENPFSEQKIDKYISFIQEDYLRILSDEAFKRIKTFRNKAASHLTFDDYSVTTEDFFEVGYNILHVSYMLGKVFRDYVDKRDHIGLYKYHLEGAKRLYNLKESLEPRFFSTKITGKLAS